MSAGILQSKVDHLAPAAQVPGAAVTLTHKQTGFCSCGVLGKISNHRMKFLMCGRKMPENCRCVKHVSEILEISPRSSLYNKGYHVPTARSTSRLSFVYASADLSDFRTGCKEQWEGGEFKWLILCTLSLVAPGEQGQSPPFPIHSAHHSNLFDYIHPLMINRQAGKAEVSLSQPIWK